MFQNVIKIIFLNIITDDLYNFQKCLVELDFLMILSNEFHSIGPIVLIALSAKTYLFLVGL